MSRIAVITDTNSSMTQEEADRLGVYLVPMPFMVDGKEYFEGVDCTYEQFFAMLAGVAPPYGSVITTAERYHYTTYSCVIDAQYAIYQYKTCFDWRVHRFDMHTVDLDGVTVFWLSAPLDVKNV